MVLTRGGRYALAVTVLVAALLVSIAGSYALSLWAINRSQGQWCDTLSLLTSGGPPKPGSPNYQRAKTFYMHMVTLRDDFGCT